MKNPFYYVNGIKQKTCEAEEYVTKSQYNKIWIDNAHDC